MANEKPGGHGERSVAVGVIDMAVWDAVAKIEGKPLYRLLADRYNEGEADDKVFVYAAGGYYYPGKNLEALQDEMRKYLDLGYSVVKMKIGGESLADDLRRIEAVIEVVGSGREARGRCERALRSRDRRRIRQGARAVRAVLVRGSGRPARLRAAGRARGPLRRRDGDRREPLLDAGRAQPDPLRRHAPRPRLAAVRLRALLRPRRIPAHAGDAERARLVAAPLHPARRPPAFAQHRRGARARRQRVVSRRLPAVRRLRGQDAGRRTATCACPTCRASASKRRARSIA